MPSVSFDFWTLWGFLAQGIFFASFVVQWYKAEKTGLSTLPIEFWLLRILASFMLLAYVVVRKDIVFFVSLILQILMYFRNVVIIKSKK